MDPMMEGFAAIGAVMLLFILVAAIFWFLLWGPLGAYCIWLALKPIKSTRYEPMKCSKCEAKALVTRTVAPKSHASTPPTCSHCRGDMVKSNHASAALIQDYRPTRTSLTYLWTGCALLLLAFLPVFRLLFLFGPCGWFLGLMLLALPAWGVYKGVRHIKQRLNRAIIDVKPG